jgi:superfamily II DNA or RNA helicase
MSIFIKVYYVNGLCSSGKTHSSCQFIRANQTRKNHLYVAPSLKLIQQTARTLRELGVEPTIITSETHEHRVKTSILKFLNDAQDAGEALLVAWNAHVDLPYFNRRENWQVVIDEVPQLDNHYA